MRLPGVLLTVSILLASAGWSSAAHAGIIFSLDHVRFSDGGNAAGSFEYDPSSGGVSHIDIVTSADGTFGFQYTDANYQSLISGAAFFTGFQFEDVTRARFEQPWFLLNLLVTEHFSFHDPNPLRTVAPSSSRECVSPFSTSEVCRAVTAGYLLPDGVASPVTDLPTPSTLALLAPVLLLLRRRT